MVATSIHPTFAQQDGPSEAEIPEVKVKWKDRFCLFGGNKCLVVKEIKE